MPRGGNVIATSKDASKALITAGSDRAVRAIDGSGLYLGGNVISTSKDAAKSLITAGSDRAVQSIEGSGCCAHCGSRGGRLPVRTVVHEYQGEGARHDLPAGKKKTKRHMEALRAIQQRDEVFVRGSDEARQHMAALRAKRGHAEVEEKPKRAGRFPKGSQAAKDHMAKLRAMRK